MITNGNLQVRTLNLTQGSPDWLEMRDKHIGGSDAAAVLGKSPFKSNVDLWRQKVGLAPKEDISDQPQVRYGNGAEDLCVKQFALDYPQYEVKIAKERVYVRGFMLASLDGELIDKATGELGVLENKTTLLHTMSEMDKWNGQVPEYYYIQVLHYLIVTGWSFAKINALIRYTDRRGETECLVRRYHYNRADVLGDLKYLYGKEKEFWEKYVIPEIEPPRILPSLERY